MFVLLLVTGCDDVDNRTAKEKAQDALLDELDNCGNAFGSNDGETKRTRHKEYCTYVLEMIDTLIRDGYFDDDGQSKKIQEEKNITKTSSIDEIEKEIYESVNNIRDSIIGEI